MMSALTTCSEKPTIQSDTNKWEWGCQAKPERSEQKRCEKGLPTRIFCCSLKLPMKQTQRENHAAKERRLQVIFPLDLGLKLPEDNSLRLLIEITEEMDYRELYAAYNLQLGVEGEFVVTAMLFPDRSDTLTRPLTMIYPLAAISSFNFLMILYASDWDTPNIFTTSGALINKQSSIF